MNKIIAILCVLYLFVACSSNTDKEVHEPPVIKSTTPEDGTINVPIVSTIEVVFDEVISLDNTHNITINGNEANVKASQTKLIFTLELQKETTYSIIIPKGAVVNTFGIFLQQEQQFSFTTEENIETIITENLVTESPSSQAVNVYNFLKDNYGINTISSVVSNGAMDTNEAEWVKYHTNKYPAMLGIDYLFLHWSPANWIDYNEIGVLKDWWNNNGLLTASWHWNIPPTQEITDITEFTFRLENDDGVKVQFKPSNVAIEGTWENQVATADFDELIGYIKLFQDENIPLVWRPLHEAAGNIYEYNDGKAWFWWGMEGGEAYVSLWRYMFNYFKDKGVNNLIWVWTTQTKDHDFYPGDDYVDIIGKDVYNKNEIDELATLFKTIQTSYPNKMITLSECGNVANISSQWNAAAKWSWFMPWCDHDRTKDINNADFTSPDHEFANAAWWIDAINHEKVITRDEMPSLK
ncbi:glycosyl hydrolase [Labilibacter marinus]|uniref:glycosyl hydrolase n=1 Tax=Labilibacter marinus TaxID=1477105 RepID=UPI0018E9847E|nr:glycosyl hydrolase [Labilibacter marinus]